MPSATSWTGVCLQPLPHSESSRAIGAPSRRCMAELFLILGEAHATVHRALTSLLADGVPGQWMLWPRPSIWFAQGRLR